MRYSSAASSRRFAPRRAEARRPRVSWSAGFSFERAAQGRDGFGGLIQREAGRAQGDEGGQGSGLRFEDGFQGGDGFALVAGHVVGQSQVEQQPGVAGLGFYELLVDGDGFFETAGAHQLVGLGQSCGEGVGLGLENRRG